MWVVSLCKNKKQNKKLQPAVVAHVKVLSQNAGNGTKSWYQSEERERKEKGEGRREGRRREGKVANVNSMTLFLPSSKVGRETWLCPPTPLHARRMKRYWFVWQKVSCSIFFFFIKPLIHPNTCSGNQSDMTQSTTSLANWWATSKENISKNIMMLAGKTGLLLPRNSQEYLFGETFL